MVVKQDKRPYISAIATSLVNGNKYQLDFLIDTGATTGQLPYNVIKDLDGKLFEFKPVTSAFRDSTVIDFFNQIGGIPIC